MCHSTFLPSATKLQRLCFYRCLSVYGGGCLVPGGLLLGGGCLVLGGIYSGGSDPRGCLVPGGAWSGGGWYPSMH